MDRTILIYMCTSCLPVDVLDAVDVASLWSLWSHLGYRIDRLRAAVHRSGHNP
jgi:hypothetical protein